MRSMGRHSHRHTFAFRNHVFKQVMQVRERSKENEYFLLVLLPGQRRGTTRGVARVVRSAKLLEGVETASIHIPDQALHKGLVGFIRFSSLSSTTRLAGCC